MSIQETKTSREDRLETALRTLMQEVVKSERERLARGGKINDGLATAYGAADAALSLARGEPK